MYRIHQSNSMLLLSFLLLLILSILNLDAKAKPSIDEPKALIIN